MRIGTRLPLLLAGMLVIGVVQTVYGNGRTVPRPKESSPVKAICHQRAGGQLEIFRVRLTGGDGLTAFNVTHKGVTRGMAPHEIKRVRFLTSEINDAGFMKAAILFRSDTEERSGMVQVRSGDSVVLLTGFTSGSAPVSIGLPKCEAVDLSLAGNDGVDPDDRGGPHS